MKKTDQPLRRTVAFDLLPWKNGSKSRSFKCLSSKPGEKIERHTSRLNFIENLAGNVKNSQSVQLVRNTEHPVKKVRSVVSFTACGINRSWKRTDVTEDASNSRDNGSAGKSDVFDESEKLKLDAPELCTSLKVANQLLEEVASESKSMRRKISSVDACSSKTLNAKVLRKVNIPFEEQIYSNLVDLKVTDDDLFVSQEKKFKSKNFERICKDKEPELSAFYKPAFDQEFIVKMEKLNIEPENLVQYDGFSLSGRMKNWQVS